MEPPTPLQLYMAQEIALYESRTPKSKAMHERARKCIPSGVSSCYQLFDPYPFYVDRSERSSVVDIDGNEMIDIHGGYGVTLFGYKHPYLLDASSRILSEQGFTVSLPGTAVVELSEHLAQRYSMPYWRFLNSGTEATLDAIRLARARHGRPFIIKIESGYHGHHDAVWVSVHAGARDTSAGAATAESIPQVPFCSGIPSETVDLTLIAEFNNLTTVEALLLSHPGQVACVIVEPVLLNCSMIKPRDGFLQALIELCREHEVAVIFDLVKINTAVAMKHITKYWSADTCGPDMYTLGKGLSGEEATARKIPPHRHLTLLTNSIHKFMTPPPIPLLGGACPVGAIGMTEEFCRIIESKKVQVSGTYNGNSLAVGIVLAVQTFVTEERQDALEALSKHMHDGCQAIIAKHGLPAIVEYIGNKGCITFFKRGVALTSVRNYQEYIQNFDPVMEQLFVYYFINRGIWVQVRDEWSVSYQLSLADAEAFIATFESFAVAVSSL